jgi:hypothetical protein
MLLPPEKKDVSIGNGKETMHVPLKIQVWQKIYLLLNSIKS